MALTDKGLEKINRALSKGPQLLSTLGSLLSEEERPTEGLRQALEQHAIKIYRIGNSAKIYAYLDEHTEQIQKLCGKEIPLEGYRKSVVLAFCKNIDENSVIGLRLQPKVEYVVSPSRESQPGDIIPIEEVFRHPQFSDFEQLSEDQKNMLHSSIANWCLKHHVDNELLLWKKHDMAKNSPHFDMLKLMECFLEAQPEDIRHRVNLPGVFIEQLLKLSK